MSRVFCEEELHRTDGLGHMTARGIFLSHPLLKDVVAEVGEPRDRLLFAVAVLEEPLLTLESLLPCGRG